MVEGNITGLARGVLDGQIECLIIERAHPPTELIWPLLTGEADLNRRPDLRCQRKLPNGNHISLGGQRENHGQHRSNWLADLHLPPCDRPVYLAGSTWCGRRLG